MDKSVWLFIFFTDLIPLDCIFNLHVAINQYSIDNINRIHQEIFARSEEDYLFYLKKLFRFVLTNIIEKNFSKVNNVSGTKKLLGICGWRQLRQQKICIMIFKTNKFVSEKAVAKHF